MFSSRRHPTLPLLLTATLALGAVTGCSTSPNSADSASAVLREAEFNTGYPLEPGNARALGYDVRWVHDLALDPGQSVVKIIRTEGPIISVEAPVNLVTALDPRTGALLWKTVVGNPLDSIVGAVADDKNVYVNSPTRIYTLARRSGDIRRIADLEYTVSGSPLRQGRLVIFGSEVGNIYAHHLDDGYTRWAYGLQAPVRVNPVTDGLQLFTVDSSGHYAMLNSRSGRLLWRGNVYAGVTADPIFHEGFLIVTSEDQSLYSLSPAIGKDRWPPFRSESRLTQTPVAEGNLIFVNEPGRGLSAVSADTGQRQWFFPGDVIPRLADGQRVIASGDDVLTSLDHATGAVQESVPTRPLQTVLADDNGGLLLLTRDGQVMEIAPSGPPRVQVAAAADAAEPDANAEADPAP